MTFDTPEDADDSEIIFPTPTSVIDKLRTAGSQPQNTEEDLPPEPTESGSSNASDSLAEKEPHDNGGDGPDWADLLDSTKDDSDDNELDPLSVDDQMEEAHWVTEPPQKESIDDMASSTTEFEEQRSDEPEEAPSLDKTIPTIDEIERVTADGESSADPSLDTSIPRVDELLTNPGPSASGEPTDVPSHGGPAREEARSTTRQVPPPDQQFSAPSVPDEPETSVYQRAESSTQSNETQTIVSALRTAIVEQQSIRTLNSIYEQLLKALVWVLALPLMIIATAGAVIYFTYVNLWMVACSLGVYLIYLVWIGNPHAFAGVSFYASSQPWTQLELTVIYGLLFIALPIYCLFHYSEQRSSTGYR